MTFDNKRTSQRSENGKESCQNNSWAQIWLPFVTGKPNQTLWLQVKQPSEVFLHNLQVRFLNLSEDHAKVLLQASVIIAHLLHKCRRDIKAACLIEKKQSTNQLTNQENIFLDLIKSFNSLAALSGLTNHSRFKQPMANQIVLLWNYESFFHFNGYNWTEVIA